MDATTVFNQAMVQTATASRSALPKAGFGNAIGTVAIPVFQGQTVVAEAKRDSGYVSLHFNVRIEIWPGIKAALEALGFIVGEASKPNHNGFSTRVATAPTSHSDVAF